MIKIQSNSRFYSGLILILLILLMGTANLYSALYSENGVSPLFYKHLVYISIGILSAFIIQFINNSYLENSSRYLYVLSIFLLIAVLLVGKKVYGAKRWLGYGTFTFQPSEFFKLFMIFFLASFYRFMPIHDSGYRLSHLVVPLGIILLPVILIVKQPDLGTAIIVFFTAFFMILLLGINRKLLLTSIITVFISFPLLWQVLKEYQRRRVLAFISPENDPLGAGYHTIQASIAIGTGGFLGKGFLKGLQSKLGFIPEKHTDFVFSVFAEEWGLLGVTFYIILNLLLIRWMFFVVKNIKDRFIFLSGAGIIILYSLHMFINLAMVTGFFPVVGVPLPLFSYGGTALIVQLTGMGFLLKISREH